MKINAKKSKSN